MKAWLYNSNGDEHIGLGHEQYQECHYEQRQLLVDICSIIPLNTFKCAEIIDTVWDATIKKTHSYKEEAQWLSLSRSDLERPSAVMGMFC